MEGNRIASAPVSCQHSSHPASTARSLSTGEGAEEGKAELPSAAAAGLANPMSGAPISFPTGLLSAGQFGGAAWWNAQRENL